MAHLVRPALVLAAAAAAGLLATGCRSDAGTPLAGPTLAASPAASPSTDTGVPGDAASPGPAPATSRSTAAPRPPATHPAVRALTCTQLRGALVGSTTLRYQGYHDSIPLGDGHWAGEDGNTVDLQAPCGIGDMNGDGAADALGVVMMDAGGSGKFFTLVFWRNSGGVPVCAALQDLGDRVPVQSVTISGGRATVVYWDRTDDQPMAVINLKRTVVYRYSSGHLIVVSQTSVPFTP